ncbi:MAG TPA: histidine kinase [Pseudonocardia sp.]|nr:histidine kinase [Pseudonocardia sp.]
MDLPISARWWARLWASPREALFDVGVVGLVIGVLVTLLWAPAQQYGGWGTVIQCGCAVPLLFRRSAPLTVLLFMVFTALALLAIGTWLPGLLMSIIGERAQGWIVLATPFAAYSALAYGRDRRRAWVMVGLITVIGARVWEPSVSVPIGVALFVVLPAVLGTYVANLTERAERAERDQHRLAEQARVEERVRLAAEMHDVVTHRVSLMVLQAGALGVTATDAATRAAAEDLRAAGCQALEELRDLVGVLRSAPGEVAEDFALPRAGGQAATPDFRELLVESESVGVAVELEQHGNPELASPVVARTAYRIVQESLTNVRKHAPGATARVVMRFGADRVRLTVRNSAPECRGDEELTASGSGTGLLGLRQRVELVSGSLYAGQTEDGGFVVDATLPSYVPTRDSSARDRRGAPHRAAPRVPDAGDRAEPDRSPTVADGPAGLQRVRGDA